MSALNIHISTHSGTHQYVYEAAQETIRLDLKTEERLIKTAKNRRFVVNFVSVFCCPLTSLFWSCYYFCCCPADANIGDRRFCCDRQDENEIGYSNWTPCENQCCEEKYSWHGALFPERKREIAKLACCPCPCCCDDFPQTYLTGPERRKLEKINRPEVRKYLLDQTLGSSGFPEVLTKIVNEYAFPPSSVFIDPRRTTSIKTPRPEPFETDYLPLD